MSLEVNIKKKYPGFSLEVAMVSNGGRLGILGASGCGKSLTLRCIAGIDQPEEGRIVINHRVVYDSNHKINIPPQKRRIGLLFQNYALFPNMTIEENIGIAVANKSCKKNMIQQMTSKFRLEGLEKHYPSQLSGGQQQRVALARIFAYEPDVIMLDEPFSALDSFLKDQLQQEILEILNSYQGDILMVSHNREELFRFCKFLTIFEKGRTIRTGSTKDVFENPSYVEAARLTGCKNISRVIKLTDYEVHALDWDISLVTERPVDEEIRYIGIRNQDIRLSKGSSKENSITFDHCDCVEDLQKTNLIYRNSERTNSENRIWWSITKAYWESTLQREIPMCVQLPKESLLLLK